MKSKSNRRRFLADAARMGAGVLILRDVATALGYQANEKLHVALVGVGVRGRHHLKAFPHIGENLVALCDVNQACLQAAAKSVPAARQYRDFHRMFDEMDRQIDAVVIATPVHTHAAVAVPAMNRGKHVYVEKPLTHNVGEARLLRDLARQKKVVTQMGNQGMATDSFRRTLELIQAGAIGDIREAHVLFESGGTGPMERPADRPAVPESVDWDLWIGPAAMRPFHPGYLNPDFPGAGGGFDAKLLGWNRWRDFGAGALGGAGSHSINLAFKALNLAALWNEVGGKIRVETEVSERCPENFPCWQMVHYDVPARGAQPPARVHWCNAWNEEIQRRGILANLEKLAGEPLAWKNGSWSPHSFLLIVGSKGLAFANFHNSVCKLLPEKDFPNAGGPPQTLPRSGSHEREWANACKGGPATMSNFDHAGPAIEMLLLGNIAALCEKPLEFDPQACKIVNHEEANRALLPARRNGWSL